MSPYATLRIGTNFSSLLPPKTKCHIPNYYKLTKKNLSQTNWISTKIKGPFHHLKTKKPYVRSLTSTSLFWQDELNYYTFFKVYILKTKCVYVTLRNFRNLHKFLIFPSSWDQVPHSQLLSNCKKISQSNWISFKMWRPFCHVKTKKHYVLSLTSPRYYFGKMSQILTLFLWSLYPLKRNVYMSP